MGRDYGRAFWLRIEGAWGAGVGVPGDLGPSRHSRRLLEGLSHDGLASESTIIAIRALGRTRPVSRNPAGPGGDRLSIPTHLGASFPYFLPRAPGAIQSTAGNRQRIRKLTAARQAGTSHAAIDPLREMLSQQLTGVDGCFPVR